MSRAAELCKKRAKFGKQGFISTIRLDVQTCTLHLPDTDAQVSVYFT